jgi:hypothetical protein
VLCVSITEDASRNISEDHREAAQIRSPAIICDAGSTGTRVYSYYIHVVTDSEARPIVELLGRTEEGISELAERGQVGLISLKIAPLIRSGLIRLGPDTPVYIFATGGVRLMDEKLRTELWEVMRMDMEIALAGIHGGYLALQVLDGTDEALYGLLAANYIVGDYNPSMPTDVLSSSVGVLDLGGSSLEVSLVGDDLKPGTEDDVLISFGTLGIYKFYDQFQLLDGSGSCDFGRVFLSMLLFYASRRATASSVET